MDSEAKGRRFGAVLSADAVGYSRLMAADEESTVATLQSYRTAIAEAVGRHEGRVADVVGDNLVAVFPSALEAVRAAVDVQRDLVRRNAALPERRRMAFRIGIHLGNLDVEGERISGDEIHVAARLERLAPAGGVYVSEDVYRRVVSNPDLHFEDLGNRSLKQIADPVHVYGIDLGIPPTESVSASDHATASLDKASDDRGLVSGDVPGTPSLFAELKRRSVFRVAGMYAVVAWVLIQIGETTFEPLGLPEGSQRLLIILVGLGFPAAVVLAWIFDLTPAGIVRTPGDPVAEATQHRIGRRIDFAIIGGLIIVLGLVLWRSERDPLPPEPPSADVRAAVSDSSAIRSLAILPLENLLDDSDQEYFADGLTEALIGDLSRIRSLRVISRTSVMQYKRERKPLPEIAKELDVDAVIEGTVFKEGNRIRITAQLIDARNDRHLWSERYDRDMRNILALQAEIARAVAKQVELELTPSEEVRLAHTPTVDPAAHEAYLKGRYFFVKMTHDDTLKAIEYFKQSVRIDENYALGYAGLADAYS